MKKIVYFSAIICSFLLVSCSKFLEDPVIKRQQQDDATIQSYVKKINLPFQKSENGIYYSITRQNTTPNAKNPELGDEVTIHYVASILDGAKYDSTSTINNKPAVFPFVGAVFPYYGFYESVLLLKNAEKGIFLIPSGLAYGTSTRTTIPANSIIRLDIDLIKLRSEETQIDDYVKANKLAVAEKTSSGMRHIRIKDNATGLAMTSGRSTSVKYIGTFLDGKSFDSGEFEVVIGDATVIKGFSEALLKMRVGEKAKFIMPSSIAYGATGKGTILPYTPLVFELEITK